MSRFVLVFTMFSAFVYDAQCMESECIGPVQPAHICFRFNCSHCVRVLNQWHDRKHIRSIGFICLSTVSTVTYCSSSMDLRSLMCHCVDNISFGIPKAIELVIKPSLMRHHHNTCDYFISLANRSDRLRISECCVMYYFIVARPIARYIWLCFVLPMMSCCRWSNSCSCTFQRLAHIWNARNYACSRAIAIDDALTISIHYERMSGISLHS